MLIRTYTVLHITHYTCFRYHELIYKEGNVLNRCSGLYTRRCIKDGRPKLHLYK